MTGPGIPEPRYREVENGFHWFQECISMGGQAPDVAGVDTSHWDSFTGERHQNQSAYVLADEQSLLFDTLSPASQSDVLELIDRALPASSLDYLVVSHPEGNHAGNAFAILEEHPNATLLVPKEGAGHGPGFESEHDLFHLGDDPDAVGGLAEQIEYVSPGDTIDLGRYQVEFRHPLYADHAFTTWMVEHATHTLFSVDWLGFHHQSSDCTRFADEFDRPVTQQDIVQFHNNVFPWLQFADPEIVARRVDQIIETFDPDRIAPAHGTLIRETPIKYMETFKDAVREISAQGDPETIQERIDNMFPAEEDTV